MSSYGPLARWYDSLTGDVPYESFADFYEQIFSRRTRPVKTVLDLACGTGTLTWILAARGYEMIAVDASPDMLSVAAEKAGETACAVPPLFLCQDLTELDLYGTVDAAVCSLDGVNYLPPEELPEVLRRLHLFLEPGGLLVFDINTPERLRSLDGELFVDETEDVLCLWRAEFDEDEQALLYGMDIFTRTGALWRREEEEHVEYAHVPQGLKLLLECAGFRNVHTCEDGPGGAEGRLHFVAENS
jgi:SAM-dependent methyltransferase